MLHHSRVRRAALHRFPYGVFYVIRADRIDVLAVYHARRRLREEEAILRRALELCGESLAPL